MELAIVLLVAAGFTVVMGWLGNSGDIVASPAPTRIRAKRLDRAGALCFARRCRLMREHGMTKHS